MTSKFCLLLFCLYHCLFQFQDRRDQVEKHTQQGIDFLEKYAGFIKARAKIEQDYAKDLRFVIILPMLTAKLAAFLVTRC